MKVLLDTNICIAVMRGHERAVAGLAAAPPADYGVSVTTVYEFSTGIAKCREPERERAKMVRLLAGRSLLSFDEPAAKRAAEVRAEFEAAGVCGLYELLIARHALTVGLSVATNSVAEFSWICALQVEDWMA